MVLLEWNEIGMDWVLARDGDVDKDEDIVGVLSCKTNRNSQKNPSRNKQKSKEGFWRENTHI